MRLGAVVALWSLMATVASAANTYSVSDGTISDCTGQSTVNVAVDSVTNIDAFLLRIDFDAARLAYIGNSVPVGSPFAGCLNFSFFTAPKTIAVSFNCLTTPAIGIGTIIQLTFKGVANGATALTTGVCSYSPPESSTCSVTGGTINVSGCPTPPPANTATATATPTNTITPTASPTPTLSATILATSTSTATAFATATPTPLATASGTATPSATMVATSTIPPIATASVTPSRTQTVNPSVTPTPSATTVATPTPTVSPTPTVKPCIGSCKGNDSVAIDDIVMLVNIALDTVPPEACPHGNPGGGPVTIDVIVAAVNNALSGCP